MTTIQQPESESATPTVALLTPGGRGAVAVIRICGAVAVVAPVVDQFFTAASGRTLSTVPIDRIVFGHWGDGTSREEVVLCRTGESQLEIHCHGGDAATRRLYRNLTELSDDFSPTILRRVSWSEQLASESSLFDAECAETLSRATTKRTAAIVARQAGGLLRAAFGEIVDLAESTVIDNAATTGLIVAIDRLLARAEFGIHLTSPWRVVLAGRPNVGKSTLINALLGYARSIVFDQPGTTRDVVTAETAFDGWPVQLSDTAGLRLAENPIEAEGVTRARQALARADLICLLLDHSAPLTDEDRALLRASQSPTGSDVAGSTPRCLIIANKSDLPGQWDAAATDWLPGRVLKISSMTGAGVSELMQRLIRDLLPDIPDRDAPVPITRRQVDSLRAARLKVVSGDAAGGLSILEQLLGKNRSETSSEASSEASIETSSEASIETSAD